MPFQRIPKIPERNSLKLVVECMLQQLDLDSALEAEKEALWETGHNVEASFFFLDRYSKGYVADTDLWQIMHADSSPGSVSFSGVCSLFRDLKARDAAKPGQVNLAELTELLFPGHCEERTNTDPKMSDDETKNVLYIVRNTIACPGCKSRCQVNVFFSSGTVVDTYLSRLLK